MIIDLHTHTTHSDGRFSVRELLEHAEERNIKILAITDHDSVDGHVEIASTEVLSGFNGKIITGVELNAFAHYAKIELLAYNFDLPIIKKWIDKTYTKKLPDNDLKEEFRLMMEACKKNGVEVDDIKYEPEMGWPIDYIFPSIKKYSDNRKYFSDRQWEDVDYFFRCCTCNPEFPVYIDYSYQVPDAKVVSETIRNAGGKVFLAHLYTYNLEDHIKYLDKLVKDNIIDGVEVYYPKFTDEQIKTLEEYCQDNNLLMSGGTDFHATKKPGDTSDIWSKLNKLRMNRDNILKWI